jgi:hypothetical protein
MNWNNYGTYWNIDHVIPLNYNKPTYEEIGARLHYTNTQPLEVSKNRKKGYKYVGKSLQIDLINKLTPMTWHKVHSFLEFNEGRHLPYYHEYTNNHTQWNSE